jgi:ATP-binding protein involved in chromosome partitioning
MMRIAIPVADGRLAMHFGHCEQFAFVDTDPSTRKIVRTQVVDAPAHEPGLLPRWLAAQGAQMIIAGGMGQRARALFAESGIAVTVGAEAAEPETIARAYLTGTLRAGENVCDH